MTNWWYIAVGIVRRWVPRQILFTVMSIRGGASGVETNPASSVAQLQGHLATAGVDIQGKQIAEIGSGRTARSGLQLLAAGAAHVTLIDLYATPLEDDTHRKQIASDCAILGLDYENALARLTVVQGDFMDLPAPEQQVDLVLSIVVLEHVQDPAAILRHCVDWLVPGGATLHIVDLRDHNLSFRYPFEMLTFADAFWERWLNLQGGFHLNRWRAPDYRQALTIAGLMNARCIPTQQDPIGAQAIRPLLAPRYRSLGIDDLAILGVVLYGERPA